MQIIYTLDLGLGLVVFEQESEQRVGTHVGKDAV